MTFPKTVGQIPYNFPTKPNAQWEGEKTRVNGALYFFGHGLSYTTFAYSNLKINPQVVSFTRERQAAGSGDLTSQSRATSPTPARAKAMKSCSSTLANS